MKDYRLNIFFTLIIVFTFFTNCKGQKKINDMKEKNENSILCSTETGMCEIKGHHEEKALSEKSIINDTDKIKVVYFTDPICSSCWGIEPQLRKLKLEYGKHIEIEYRMGGLLPDWSYNSGGISKPSDVAKHWDEASIHYNMPIDGDIWLEDPLNSSYPPSIAFKAAQLQSNEKSILFMREIREMLFLKKKNIAKWENIAKAAKNVGLNETQLKVDFDGRAIKLFEEDLNIARDFRVRGFPTMFFMNKTDDYEIVYGSKPYAFYEVAILKIKPNITKNQYDKSWNSLFDKYNSLTLREFSELSGMSNNESEKLLNELTEKGNLEVLTIKHGSIWTIKK